MLQKIKKDLIYFKMMFTSYVSNDIYSANVCIKSVSVWSFVQKLLSR